MARTDITNLIQSELPDNNTEAITPEDLRAVCIALNDNKFQLGEDTPELIHDSVSNLIRIVNDKLIVSIAPQSHEALQNLNGELYLDPDLLPSGGGSVSPIAGNIIKKDNEDRLYAKVSSASNTLLSVDNEGLVLGNIAAPFHYVDSITPDKLSILYDQSEVVTFTIVGRYLMRNCTVTIDGTYFTNVSITNRVENYNITTLTVTATSIPKAQGTYEITVNVLNNGVVQTLLPNQSINKTSISWLDARINNSIIGSSNANKWLYNSFGTPLQPTVFASNVTSGSLQSELKLYDTTQPCIIEFTTAQYNTNPTYYWFGLTNRPRSSGFIAQNEYRYYLQYYAHDTHQIQFFDTTGQLYWSGYIAFASKIIKIEILPTQVKFYINNVLVATSNLAPVTGLYLGLGKWVDNFSFYIQDVKLTGRWLA